MNEIIVGREESKIIIDDFTMGIPKAARFGGTSTISGLLTTRGRLGQFTDVRSNSFAFGQYGYLVSGFAADDVTNVAVVTDTPRNIAVADVSGGEAYMIGSSGTAYQVTGTLLSTVTDGDDDSITFPYPIGTGSTVGRDCIDYNVNGTDFVFFSYYTGTIGALAHLDYKGSGAGRITNLFTKLNSTNDVPFPMTIGGDGFLYIGDENKVDSVDSALAIGSAYSSNVLDLPPKFVISSLIPYGSYLAVLAYPKIGGTDAANSSRFGGKCGLFFWDYKSPSFEPRPIYFNDNFSGALFEGEDGVLYGFTQGKDSLAKLRRFNGLTFDVVTPFGGDVPQHGNTDTYRDQIIWGTSKGVYTWGKSLINGEFALNNIGTGVVGFVKTPTANTNDYQFHAAGSKTFQVAQASGYLGDDVRSVWTEMPFASDITAVRLTFHPLVNSTESITFILRKNSSSTEFSAGTVKQSEEGNNVVSKTFKVDNLKGVNFLQWGIDYVSSGNTQVFVRRVEIFFTPSDKAFVPK